MDLEGNNPYAEVVMASLSEGNQPMDPTQIGMIQQVKVIGILLIAEGFLELATGGLLIAISFFIGNVFAMQPPGAGPATPQASIDFMEGMYVFLGVMMIVLSVTRFFAALACFWFKGRTWIIVSLFLGLATAFSGFCGVTSVGLCIYGLIVMFNPAVVRAFDWVGMGNSRRELTRLYQGG